LRIVIISNEKRECIMNYRGIPLMILSISLLLGSYPSFAQPAEELLPKAIQLEEVKGELEEALEIYQTIVREYPDNRPVAAKAYYHIGMCYEKLGRKEAMKAYQQVIQHYGEQKEVVAKAQGRLSILQPGKLAEKPDGIRIRQIWKSPYQDYLGSVSFDGSIHAYIFWGDGDVAIQNLITGENKVLTNEAHIRDSTHFAETPVISKDGKQIAYSWWNPYNTNDLRIIDVDNPSPRLLYKKKGEEVYPVAWLSDHEIIAARYDMNNRTANITSFNVVDGTFHDLKRFDRLNWTHLACSPDEKYIAYDFANETKGGNFDINILPIDGSSEISIIEHPANDRLLGWIPGRREFLFLSDRSGFWDLWAITIDDGKPSGPVKRIYNNIGEVSPVGFSQNGDCYVGFSRHKFNTYIAPFNAQTGDIKLASGKSLKGSNFWVNWSPDGQYLAYVKLETNDDNPYQLFVQDLKTGEERKLTEKLSRSRTPCWSPDGNKILVVGFEESMFQTKGYKGAVYTVDVKTGKADQILSLSDYQYNVPEDDAFPLSDLEWSSDGKSIYLLFFKDRLIKHELETGVDKILYNHTDFNQGTLGISPDGNNLLFGKRIEGEEKSCLVIIPAEGGKETELCTTQDTDNFDRALWSPDGRYIYFTERSEGTNLWQIPAEGGEPRKVWHTDNNRVPIFSIHPNGHQIAFAIHEGTTEVKVIENLVSELDKLDNQNK
jgi:Tol biopolymer transport system component